MEVNGAQDHFGREQTRSLVMRYSAMVDHAVSLRTHHSKNFTPTSEKPKRVSSRFTGTNQVPAEIRRNDEVTTYSGFIPVSYNITE